MSCSTTPSIRTLQPCCQPCRSRTHALDRSASRLKVKWPTRPRPRAAATFTRAVRTRWTCAGPSRPPGSRSRRATSCAATGRRSCSWPASRRCSSSHESRAMTGMPRVLRMLILFVPALVASWSPANAQPAHPIGQDYRVPGVSAKDGSPLMLYAYEKHGLGIDPNELAAGGRIVLVLHGATTSGRVNYDVQVPGVPLERSFSLMDQLSARGYDVWTLDYQNYGRSDHHDCGLCVTTEAAARDVEAVAEFILGLRKAERLHLIGWSLGAQTGGLFAQRHPDRVNRLVLYAPLLDLQGPPPPTDEFRTNNEAALTGFFHPTARVPEAVQAYLQAALEVDAQSPNGVLVDWRTDPMKIDPRQL